MRIFFSSLFVIFFYERATVSAAGTIYDQARLLFINAWVTDPCVLTDSVNATADGEDMRGIAQRCCSAALDIFLELSWQEKQSCIGAHTAACQEFLNSENKKIHLCAFECQQGRRTLETLADSVVNRNQFLARVMTRINYQAEQIQQSLQSQQQSAGPSTSRPPNRSHSQPRSTSLSPRPRRTPKSKSLSPPTKSRSRSTARSRSMSSSPRRRWPFSLRRSP